MTKTAPRDIGNSTIEMLGARAAMIDRIREFFAARGVLEVHTPAITEGGITDPNIESLALADGRFLRTSPEYAHKRLLAGGSGDIYELGPVYRAGEFGRFHREEFLLLEWYRLGWTWRALADEVLELITRILARIDWQIEFVAWRNLLQRETGIDFEAAEERDLRAAAPGAPEEMDLPGLLDWVFATRLQPSLPEDQLTVVHDFPACQAALARLNPEAPQWAERFEILSGSLELANGYRELTDPAEQKHRFEADNQARRSLGRAPMPVDRKLMNALEAGLPECSGVALGVDRLMMISESASDIADIHFFPR